VGLAEAVDGVVVKVIARTAVPAAEPRVRPGLDHAEGAHRRRVRVPVAAGADEGVDEGEGVGQFGLRKSRLAGKTCQTN